MLLFVCRQPVEELHRLSLRDIQRQGGGGGVVVPAAVDGEVDAVRGIFPFVLWRDVPLLRQDEGGGPAVRVQGFQGLDYSMPNAEPGFGQVCGGGGLGQGGAPVACQADGGNGGLVPVGGDTCYL